MLARLCCAGATKRVCDPSGLPEISLCETLPEISLCETFLTYIHIYMKSAKIISIQHICNLRSNWSSSDSSRAASTGSEWRTLWCRYLCLWPNSNGMRARRATIGLEEKKKHWVAAGSCAAWRQLEYIEENIRYVLLGKTAKVFYWENLLCKKTLLQKKTFVKKHFCKKTLCKKTLL